MIVRCIVPFKIVVDIFVVDFIAEQVDVVIANNHIIDLVFDSSIVQTQRKKFMILVVHLFLMMLKRVDDDEVVTEECL